MQVLRAHHLKLVLKTLERAFLSQKWNKDKTIPLELFIDNEVNSNYRREVAHLKETLKRGATYPDEEQDVIQYIGPAGENEQRYYNMSVEYFTSICKFIVNGEGILRIQTDPSIACESCWLANSRKFGLHCVQDLNTPDEDRNFYFPLENDDIIHLNVLSNILCIPIVEEPGINDGIVNKYIDIKVEVMRELIIRNGEFSSKIIIEIADQLRDMYEQIGVLDFDWIFYVYNQRA